MVQTTATDNLNLPLKGILLSSQETKLRPTSSQHNNDVKHSQSSNHCLAAA